MINDDGNDGDIAMTTVSRCCWLSRKFARLEPSARPVLPEVPGRCAQCIEKYITDHSGEREQNRQTRKWVLFFYFLVDKKKKCLSNFSFFFFVKLKPWGSKKLKPEIRLSGENGLRRKKSPGFRCRMVARLFNGMSYKRTREFIATTKRSNI